MFAIMALSFIKWFRTSAYRPSPAIKVEDRKAISNEQNALEKS